MKQTAVEWFLNEFQKQVWFEENSELDLWIKNLIPKAKAMEKEQMVAFAEFVATYSDKNININGEMLHAKSKYDGAERTIDLLNQYYESKTNL
jgi:hypothetical protein